MTSTATIRPSDAPAATAASSPPTIPAGAAPVTPTTLTESLRKHLRRIIATVVGLCTVMAVPGTAFAYTQPIRPESATVPNVSSYPTQTSGSHAASSGWELTSVLGVVVIAVLAVGLVLVAQRIARHRRAAHPTVVSA